ncbi:unnamed protein product, partial [Arabidopsis halleri]
LSYASVFVSTTDLSPLSFLSLSRNRKTTKPSTLNGGVLTLCQKPSFSPEKPISFL